MKLIDIAKDTRVTHPLHQTDLYSDSLAHTVVAQQNNDVHKDTHYTEKDMLDETAFGAQTLEEAADEKERVDYYGIVHRIKEKVNRQPSILVGRTPCRGEEARTADVLQ
jgi:ATP-dependent helicase STH1/SNF2